jgi:hypothetical protein
MVAARCVVAVLDGSADLAPECVVADGRNGLIPVEPGV